MESSITTRAMVLTAALGLPAWLPASAASVFINEFHYDNDGSDLNEFIEIAGPALTSLEGWTIVLYNGSSGNPYRTVNLTGSISSQSGDFGAVSFPVAGIQNGAPDGLALVDDSGAVVELLSYEGTFTATGGPAASLNATDILASETGTEDPGLSIQRFGVGDDSSAFGWVGPRTASPGALNAGQLFAPPQPVPLPASLLLLISGLCVGVLSRVRGARCHPRFPRAPAA